MDNFTVRLAQKEDFEAVSTLIAEQNKHAETHCIHSDTSEDAESICNEMMRLDAADEMCFVMASSDGQVTGAMGCELDVELGRGWLRGPFIEGAYVDWNTAAVSLFEKLLELLPASIRQLDTFLDVENRRGNDFYLSQGFEQLRLVHVYVCPLPENKIEASDRCEPLSSQTAQKFIDLHDSIFPGTYATGQRILAKMDDRHQVFIMRQKDEVIGYCCANIDEDTGDGSFDFLGVREEFRGRGIGRELLKTALAWFFEEKKLPRVILVVHNDLANARSLYESVGFRLKYTGVHNRKGSES